MRTWRNSRSPKLDQSRQRLARLRLELLEERLPPGDLLLSALAPTALQIGANWSDSPLLPVSQSNQGQAGQQQIVQLDASPVSSLDLSLRAVDDSATSEPASFQSVNAVQGGQDGYTSENSSDPFSTNWLTLESARPTRPLTRGVNLAHQNVHNLPDGAAAPVAFQGGITGGSGYQGVDLASTASGLPNNFAGLASASSPATPAGDQAVSPDSILNIARDGYTPAGWTAPETPALDSASSLPASPGVKSLANQLSHYLASTHQAHGPSNGPPEDPGAIGPLATTRIEYSLGDVTLPGTIGPVEVQASVTYPTGLPGGERPLIVFLHGRHSTCFQGASAFLEWPCTGAHEPIPSFRGYDYASDVLASHDYIVISVGANGVNARDNMVNDLGAQWRAQVIQHHLDLWNTWSTKGGGPAGIGDDFIGKVDMQNIGTMGHSRGGEGVVRHFLYNQSLGSPYGINAVFPLAPVDFNRPLLNNVSMAVLVPYCDGDVSDLQGIHFYDDARYNVPGDLAFRHTIQVMGANHNFYNTIWTPGGWPAGTADDWTAFTLGGASDPFCGTVAGNGRLTPAQEQGTGLAYMSAFFRIYLGGDWQFLPYLNGDSAPPPSSLVTRDKIIVSFQSGDIPMYRLDVNHLLTAADLTTNTLGGAVTQNDLTPPYELCGGDVPQALHCMPTETDARQPHTTRSARSSRRGLSQLRLTWDANDATYENDLPAAAQDVSAYYALQFRVGLNFTDVARNPVGQAQDFSVILIDGAGNSESTSANYWATGALNYPPGTTGTFNRPVPKLILNTVRIPLGAFPDVDLTHVVAIVLAFDQTPRGALLFTDLGFTGF